MARIIAIAAVMLEDRDRARVWLRDPNHALGGRPPLELLELLDTEPGARPVEETLRRIEAGIYS